jgi:CDP-6-deoxy-D-xylo-4-hexulose-3-dehydrase
MKVPVGNFIIGKEEKAAVNAVLDSGRVSEGKYTRLFEQEWAKYIGTKYAVALNSGTSAIIAGLLSLVYDDRFPKVKSGAKVITSPVTYIATANAIKLAGLEPVFADIHLHDFTIDCDKVEDLLKKDGNVAAIIPVHLFGFPNDMDRLNRLSRKYDVVLFEDSAQAHGSIYKGKKVGSLSLLSDFSFYIAHNIQAGELGVITTNDSKIFSLIKRIKANGRMCDCAECLRTKGLCKYLKDDQLYEVDPRFHHELIGANFKTTEFQTALALSQLKHADEIFKKRSENVKYLNKELNKYKNILNLPVYHKNVSYLAYPIVIKDQRVISRKYLRKHLETLGVETRPLFKCIPNQQPAYQSYHRLYKDNLPNADFVGSNGFYVACHQYLTKTDLNYISKVFGEILGKISKKGN